MKRPLRFAILSLTIGLSLVAANLSATTYYIAANGSDGNNGTTQGTPWMHAPGMPNCTSVCASTTPQPGDSFIFRGGDTWHFGNSSLSPYVGVGSGYVIWNWTWSGNSSACNLNAAAGAIVTTSCIYIGVDKTWYSGSSWARPILNMDNPLNNGGLVSGCAHDDSAWDQLDTNGASYLILDSFETVGRCWNGNAGAANWALADGGNGTGANQVEISNLYIHGWTMSVNAQADTMTMLYANLQSASNTSYELITGLICDGSDSTNGTNPTSSTGLCVSDDANKLEISKSVFNRISNGCLCSGIYSFHDNLVEFNLNTTVGTTGQEHGNVVETGNGISASGGGTSGNMYFYNNVFHDIFNSPGQSLYLNPGPGSNLYFFNNVLYNVTKPGQCILLAGNGLLGASNFYLYNNTFDLQNYTNDGCAVIITSDAYGEPFNGTVYVANNHNVGIYSPQNYSTPGCCTSLLNIASGAMSVSIVDNGGSVWQTEATANAQGYVQGNNYAPTSANGSTVGSAVNLASSCSTLSPDSAFCSGSSGGASEQASNGGYVAVAPSTPPRNVPSGCTPTAHITGCWDAGAYLFSSGTVTQPIAPAGLSATAQ
jgi:hypothetical protein